MEQHPNQWYTLNPVLYQNEYALVTQRFPQAQFTTMNSTGNLVCRVTCDIPSAKGMYTWQFVMVYVNNDEQPDSPEIHISTAESYDELLKRLNWAGRRTRIVPHTYYYARLDRHCLDLTGFGNVYDFTQRINSGAVLLERAFTWALYFEQSLTDDGAWRRFSSGCENQPDYPKKHREQTYSRPYSRFEYVRYSPSTNPNCRHVVLSQRAYNAIISEVLSYDETETGGVLIGNIHNNIWYVVDAIPPGPSTSNTSVHFAWDKTFVDYMVGKSGGIYRFPLTVLGFWHRHPGSLDTFSGEDERTMADNLRHCNYGLLSMLVNIDPQLRMTFYHARDRQLMPMRYDVGDDYFPKEILELASTKDLLARRKSREQGANLRISYTPTLRPEQMPKSIFPTQQEAEAARAAQEEAARAAQEEAARAAQEEAARAAQEEAARAAQEEAARAAQEEAAPAEAQPEENPDAPQDEPAEPENTPADNTTDDAEEDDGKTDDAPENRPSERTATPPPPVNPSTKRETPFVTAGESALPAPGPMYGHISELYCMTGDFGKAILRAEHQAASRRAGDAGSRLIVISGAPGTGKTTLAMMLSQVYAGYNLLSRMQPECFSMNHSYIMDFEESLERAIIRTRTRRNMLIIDNAESVFCTDRGLPLLRRIAEAAQHREHPVMIVLCVYDAAYIKSALPQDSFTHYHLAPLNLQQFYLALQTSLKRHNLVLTEGAAQQLRASGREGRYSYRDANTLIDRIKRNIHRRLNQPFAIIDGSVRIKVLRNDIPANPFDF